MIGTDLAAFAVLVASRGSSGVPVPWHGDADGAQ